MEKLIARVTAKGKLELPPEIEAQLKPFAEYEISITEEEIALKKAPRRLIWEELKRRQDELGPDPDEPTLEEISDIVKEVRRELYSNK
jgi:hypothetical protein